MPRSCLLATAAGCGPGDGVQAERGLLHRLVLHGSGLLG
jgi:hypothetical protein